MNCNDCSKFYIGQTGRQFYTRYKEHIPTLKNNKHSTFAEHLINTLHTTTNITQNMEILHITQKGRKLDTLEQFEIYKNTITHKDDILNDQLVTKNELFEYYIHKYNLHNNNTQ